MSDPSRLGSCGGGACASTGMEEAEAARWRQQQRLSDESLETHLRRLEARMQARARAIELTMEARATEAAFDLGAGMAVVIAAERGPAMAAEMAEAMAVGVAAGIPPDVAARRAAEDLAARVANEIVASGGGETAAASGYVTARRSQVVGAAQERAAAELEAVDSAGDDALLEGRSAAADMSAAVLLTQAHQEVEDGMVTHETVAQETAALAALGGWGEARGQAEVEAKGEAAAGARGDAEDASWVMRAVPSINTRALMGVDRPSSMAVDSSEPASPEMAAYGMADYLDQPTTDGCGATTTQPGPLPLVPGALGTTAQAQGTSPRPSAPYHPEASTAQGGVQGGPSIRIRRTRTRQTYGVSSSLVEVPEPLHKQRIPTQVVLPQFPLPTEGKAEQVHHLSSYLAACSTIISTHEGSVRASYEPPTSAIPTMGAPHADRALGPSAAGSVDAATYTTIVAELEELRRLYGIGTRAEYRLEAHARPDHQLPGPANGAYAAIQSALVGARGGRADAAAFAAPKAAANGGGGGRGRSEAASRESAYWPSPPPHRVAPSVGREYEPSASTSTPVGRTTEGSYPSAGQPSGAGRRSPGGCASSSGRQSPTPQSTTALISTPRAGIFVIGAAPMQRLDLTLQRALSHREVRTAWRWRLLTMRAQKAECAAFFSAFVDFFEGLGVEDVLAVQEEGLGLEEGIGEEEGLVSHATGLAPSAAGSQVEVSSEGAADDATSVLAEAEEGAACPAPAAAASASASPAGAPSAAQAAETTHRLLPTLQRTSTKLATWSERHWSREIARAALVAESAMTGAPGAYEAVYYSAAALVQSAAEDPSNAPGALVVRPMKPKAVHAHELGAAPMGLPDERRPPSVAASESAGAEAAASACFYLRPAEGPENQPITQPERITPDHAGGSALRRCGGSTYAHHAAAAETAATFHHAGGGVPAAPPPPQQQYFSTPLRPQSARSATSRAESRADLAEHQATMPQQATRARTPQGSGAAAALANRRPAPALPASAARALATPGNGIEFSKLSQEERRAYMLRLIFDSEGGSPSSTLSRGKDASKRLAHPGGHAAMDARRQRDRLVGPPSGSLAANGNNHIPSRGAASVLIAPQPPPTPSGRSAADGRASLGAYPRRPLPSGAGGVYVCSPARGATRSPADPSHPNELQVARSVLSPRSAFAEPLPASADKPR